MKSIRYILFIVCSTTILQSCSWIHFLQIKNTTDVAWQIEYEIEDARGIFNTEIYVRNDNSSSGNLIEFEQNKIVFEIKPNQTVRMGMARSSRYSVYKKFTQFDKEIPWKAYLNVEEIKISSQNKIYTIDTAEMEDILGKNSYGKATIYIDKVCKSKNHSVP